MARQLLAGAFIAGAIDTVIAPRTRIESARELMDRGVPLLPDRLSPVRSPDPAQVVRITAAARVGGAMMLATGRAPRLAALILAAATVPAALTEQDFWNEDDPDRRSAKRIAFWKDAGLLGGTLIAAADSGPAPSLGWRARRRADALLHSGSDRDESRVSRLAEAVAQQAPAVWEIARDKGEHAAGVTREKGELLAAVAHDKGGQLAEIARRRGEQFGHVARDTGGRLAATYGGHAIA
ncbi:DoxX family membrane protein [Nocardia stercoris]|uniref:DoxX family membrane protein n=1 Tax=Nocardia stercoris TaxID=2483361 RepID=UPI00131A410D|nr:DoxX family membrane protein [Nocardia stercoris]